MNNYGEIVRVSDDGQSAVVSVGGLEFTAQLMRPVGDASTPIKGDKVLLSKVTGKREQVIVAYYDSKVEATDQGGRLLYSRDSNGNKTAQIELTADGNVYLNGSGKSLVTYEDLDYIFNAPLIGFIAQINTLLGTKADGSGAKGELTLDLSSAKTTTVKTDG